MFRCYRKKLSPMLCNQCFIRCCHAFSSLKAAFYKRIGRLDSSHYFYDNLYIFIRNNRLKIMYDLLLHRIPREILHIQYIFNVQLITDSLIDARSVGINHFYHSGTYCSVAHYCYIDHIFPPFSRLRFFSDMH